MTPEEMAQLLAEGKAELRVTESRGSGRAKALFRTLPSGWQSEVYLHIKPRLGREQASPRLYSSQSGWSVAELQERGLPLYWSKEWMRQQIASHKSYASIHQTTGYPPATLRRWREKHGLSEDPRKAAIRRDYQAGIYRSKRELAEAYEISMPTLNRILRQE